MDSESLATRPSPGERVTQPVYRRLKFLPLGENLTAIAREHCREAITNTLILERLSHFRRREEFFQIFCLFRVTGGAKFAIRDPFAQFHGGLIDGVNTH